VRALAGDWEKAHAYAKQAMQAREDETLLPMSLTSWYETEALLRGGDGALARAEAERLDALAGDNKRYRLVALHCKAGLAMWDTDFDTAIHHLRAAHGLAQEVGYRSQERSILVTLSDLYEEQGDDSAAEETRENAANIARRLAESIDDPDLRAAFLAGNA
jgi:ATP/maltotriose-dependent transcriptional regulator MalT